MSSRCPNWGWCERADLTALETEVRAAILSVFAVPGPPGNVPTDEKDDRSGRGEDQFIRTTMALLLACVVLSLPITWGWQCLGEMSRLAAAIERTIEASWNRKP